MNTFHVETVTDPAQLAALEPAWTELLADSAVNRIFLSWPWIGTWLEVFAPRYQPRFLLVYTHPGGNLLAVAPLVLSRRRWLGCLPIRELTFAGADKLSSDHLDFIIRRGHEAPLAALFAEHLLNRPAGWDILRLDGMHAASPTLAQLCARRTPALAHTEPAPFLPLPATWDAVRRTLGHDLRRNLRRLPDYLERDYPGQVAFRSVTRPDELPAAMESLFALHWDSRRRHDRRSVFLDPEKARLHHRLARRLLEHGWLRLHLLTVAGEDIAAAYMFHYGGVTHWYQGGFLARDPWLRYSAGNLVGIYGMQRAIAEGAQEFDFLRGHEPYKYAWTTQVRHNHHARWAGSRWGRLLLAVRALGTSAPATEQRAGAAF